MHASMAFAACNGDETFPLDWEYENWFNTSLLFQPQLLDLNQEPAAFSNRGEAGLCVRMQSSAKYYIIAAFSICY